MSNETKYCIQRKDLLESNQKVPVGATYMTIDKPTEYRWLTEDDFFIKVNGGWESALSVDFDFIESTPSTKHTPAPWKVSKHVDTNETVIRSNDGDIIANLECDKVQDFMKDPKAEVEANARLIAAAPTMYEALVAIRAIRNGEWDNPVLKKYEHLPTNDEDAIFTIANEALKGIE